MTINSFASSEETTEPSTLVLELQNGISSVSKVQSTETSHFHHQVGTPISGNGLKARGSNTVSNTFITACALGSIKFPRPNVKQNVSWKCLLSQIGRRKRTPRWCGGRKANPGPTGHGRTGNVRVLIKILLKYIRNVLNLVSYRLIPY